MDVILWQVWYLQVTVCFSVEHGGRGHGAEGAVLPGLHCPAEQKMAVPLPPQLMTSFIKVMSRRDESHEFDWPEEMVQYTVVQPAISFSCNPLLFDFSRLLPSSSRHITTPGIANAEDGPIVDEQGFPIPEQGCSGVDPGRGGKAGRRSRQGKKKKAGHKRRRRGNHPSHGHLPDSSRHAGIDVAEESDSSQRSKGHQGEKVRRTGEKVRRTGEKVRHTGEKVRHAGEKVRHAGEEKVEKSPDRGDRQCSSCEDQRIEQKRHQSASRSERKVAHGAKCGVALCGNADDSAANKTIPVVAFVEATMRRPQHRRNKKHRRHRIGLSHKPETSCLAVDRKPVGPTDGRKPNEPKVRIDYTENEEDCNIFSTGVCDPTDFSTTKKTEKIDVPHIPEPGGLEAGKMPAVLDIGRGRVEKDTVVCGENGMLSVRAKAEKRSCALGTDFSRQVNSEASCNPAGVDDAQESVSNPKPVPAASFERKRQVCQPSGECEPSSKVCRVDVSEIVPSESNAVLGWTLADGAYERHSQVGKSKWESDSENDVDFLKRVVDPEHENVSSAQQGTKVNRMNRQPEHRGRRKDNEAVQRQKTTHKLRRSESSEGSSCYVSGDSYSQTNSYSRSRSYSQSSRSSYDYSSHCRSSSRYSSRSCSFRSSSRGTSRSRSGGRNCSFSSYSESSFITSNSRYFRRSRSRSSSRSRSHYRFRSVRRKLHRRRVIRGLYDSSSNLKCVVSNVDEVKGRDATEIPLPVADEVPTSKEQEKVTNIPLPAADSAISLPSSSTTEGVVTCSVCGSDPTPDQSTTTASCTTQGGLSVSTATAIVGNPDSVPGVGPCGDSSHNRQSTVHSVGMVNDDRSAISVSATNESENVVYSTAVVGRDSSSSEAGPRFLPRSLLLHGPRLLDQYGFGQLPHNSEEWPCLPKSFAQQAPEFVQPRQRFECQPRVCELPQRLAGQLRHFGNIPQRFDGPPKRFDGPPQRFNGGSQHFNVPPQRFDGRSQRFNGPPQRLDGPPQRSDGPHHRFDGPHCHFDGPPQCIHRPPQRLDGPDQHLNWPPQRLDGPPQRLDRPPQRLDGALQRLDGPPRRFDGPLNVLDGMLQPRVLRSTPPVEAHHRLSNSACPPHLRTVQCLRDMPSLRNTFATPQGPPPRGMLPVDVKQELGVATRCPNLRQRPPLNTSLSDVGHSLRPQSMPTQPAPPPIGAHRFNLPALGGLPGPREQHAQYSPTHPERHIPPLLTRDMSMTLGGQTQPASVIATLPQSFASRPQSDTLQPPRLCGQPSSPSCPTAVPQNMSVPPPPGFNAHLLGLNPPPILPSLPLDARSVTKVSPPFPPHTCQSLRQLPPQPSTAAAINIPPTKSSPPPLPPPKPPSPQPPPPPKKEELKPMQPVIPPERIDQYRRLQELAQKHARKQLRRQQQRERGEPESESSEGEQEAVDGAILPEDDDATESELAEMERAALEAGRSFLARGHAAAIVVPAVAESPLLQQPHHTVLISPQPSISSIPLAAGTQFLQAGQHILVPSSYMSQASAYYRSSFCCCGEIAFVCCFCCCNFLGFGLGQFLYHCYCYYYFIILCCFEMFTFTSQWLFSLTSLWIFCGKEVSSGFGCALSSLHLSVLSTSGHQDFWGAHDFVGVER